MANGNQSFQRAMRLAAISGLKTMLGPALVASAQRRPERHNLVAAALGELVIDKLPLVPSRSSLPLLVPRAMAGAWVARAVMEEEGNDDPWVPVMGAAVAAGVATFAPMVRGTLRRVLGVPDYMIGLAEDYLAIKMGSEAVGLSMDEVTRMASDAVDDVKNRLLPAETSGEARPQSIGAGSM